MSLPNGVKQKTEGDLEAGEQKRQNNTSYHPPPRVMQIKKQSGGSSVETSLIIKNPTVVLPRLDFLLGGQSGNIEDDTNFFSTLAHELA
mmetsp:Transcript_30487/g.55316  ORF Transcript_30487/g.55316 Transcript_30487/m.55316 type:complete len:89 (-) Transcript_30487:507-773(-)